MSAYTSHVTRLVSGPGGLSSHLLSAAGRAISHCPPRALRVVGSLLVDGVHRLAKGGWSRLGLKDISSGQGGIRRDHRDEHGAARPFWNSSVFGQQSAHTILPCGPMRHCQTLSCMKGRSMSSHSLELLSSPMGPSRPQVLTFFFNLKSTVLAGTSPPSPAHP